MEDSARLGLRHWAISDHNHLKDHLRDHPALKLMDVCGERDTAILERNTAIAERKAAYAERDAAFLQRDVAYADRNNALMERDAAVVALDMVRTERDRRQGNANDATSKFLQMVNMAVSCPSLETELQALHKGGTEFRAALDGKLPLKQGKKTEKENPKKRKNSNLVDQDTKTVKSPSKKKDQQHLFSESHNKVETHMQDQEKAMSTLVFDSATTIPIPYCSCTGVNQQCYRWGNGGWQSACCTNFISMHPLPMNPKKCGSRVSGRKMSGGAFKKLLEKLVAQGLSINCQVDLKLHWAKHGTNRYVTIK